MAHPQHNGPELFEVIRRRGDSQSGREAMQVPGWWSNDGVGQTRRRSSTHDWLTAPVRMHVNRAMLLGSALVIVAMVVIGYQFGRAGGGPDQPLMAADRQLPVRDLPAGAQTGNRPAPAAKTGSGADHVATSQAEPVETKAPFIIAASAEGRLAGYNYYCLATMPIRYRAEAERAVGFLATNGVDADVVAVQNRWLQVIALRGFERTTSPQAREHESLLRSLGRVWKAERRGWSDWSDLYAIKHRG